MAADLRYKRLIAAEKAGTRGKVPEVIISARYHILLDKEVSSSLRVLEFDLTKQDTQVYFCLHRTGGTLRSRHPCLSNPKSKTISYVSVVLYYLGPAL